VTSKNDVGRALPAMLLTLTVVTGVVDAASYLSLGHMFVANMTGNVVFSASHSPARPVCQRHHHSHQWPRSCSAP